MCITKHEADSELALCQSERKKEQQKLKKLSLILKNSGITAFEYNPQSDLLTVYDDTLRVVREIPEYISYLEEKTTIHPEDRWKAIEFYRKKMSGTLELRVIEENGLIHRKVIDVSPLIEDGSRQYVMIGSVKDVTLEKKREEVLEDQAKRDSLTMLYNHAYGKDLINEYLERKDPYDTCGLLVIDIDYFKNINDTYGHLFGDKVLSELSRLFFSAFDHKDIIMRAGGDEFVILLKGINHSALVKKADYLLKSIRKLTFIENDCSITCSIGVCFLPKNISGYTYDQLFENADWALYRAKENGKNRCVFCDSLQRFQLMPFENAGTVPDIDARYLRNDVIATAFEIFEKTNSFDSAIHLLFRVIGIRFRLDRITIIQTNISKQSTARQYQWTSPNTPEALPVPSSFTKEDFLTLFHSYDEYGTTVLQHDNMCMFSKEAADLLIQGDAKTVVYAAMYCEGKYTGAISYVVCDSKRYWSRQDRSQLGELTKIISAHLSKSQAINASCHGLLSAPEYDSLTGLLSFSRFREEVERIIVGDNTLSRAVVYSDFEDFKYFNKRYGYRMGDQLLIEFSNYIMGTLKEETDVYFTRVIADQFILFMPYEFTSDTAERVQKINDDFLSLQSGRFPDARLRIRSGIYQVKPGCLSASAAVDAANYARKQITGASACTVKIYDDSLEKKQFLEHEIINGMKEAIETHQFLIYLQPRFSTNDLRIIGAEALIRWQREDGTILYPDSFIPLFERNGSIIDLDLYIFEQVVAYLAKNNRLGRKQVPISINASILHASRRNAAEQYLQILNKYQVDPALTELELTETTTISDYQNVKKMFQKLQELRIMTSLDDFGAGYSLLNTVADIPVNTVKIDRGFILSCETSKKGIFLLQQTIHMIKGFGYHVVCEGIETEEQLHLVKEAGCEEGQGYYFAKPMPLEEFERIMYGKPEA